MAKYSKKISDEICRLIRADSYTVAEICKLTGISERSYYLWKDKNADFAEAIKEARAGFISSTLVDCERSLIKLINGYEYEEKKTVTVDDGTGRPKIKEQTVTKKHVAPNLGAVIHFQTNKDPENWKNRQSSEVTGKDGKDLIPNEGKNIDEIKAELKEIVSKLNE